MSSIPNLQLMGRERGRREIVVGSLRLLKNFLREESARLKAKDFQVPLNRRLG
jgi:hypothetical protein